MRYKVLFTLLLSLFSQSTFAHWEKINDLDYTWGPFKIYNITLFTENGEYRSNTRPLMLSLKYDKPVDGRDFAISIARSWASLDIKLPEQNKIIERLRRALPDLKSGDVLSYIALENKGYFIVNDQIIPEEFDKTINDAIVAVWLDPKVDLSKKITMKKVDNEQAVHIAQYTIQEINHTENKTKNSAVEQIQSFAIEQSAFSEKVLEQPAIGVPTKAIVEEPKSEPTTPEPEQANIVQNTENQTDKKEVESTEPPKSDPEPKHDPENPEREIRPIEDPMPKNKRAS